MAEATVAQIVSEPETVLLSEPRLADDAGSGSESADNAVRFAVRIFPAVYHAKHTVRMPAIVPEAHGDAILRGEFGRRQVIAIEGDMGVNGPRPFGRATLFH